MQIKRGYSNEISKWLQDFMHQDSASGILLIVAAVLAMVLENSPLSWFYDVLLSTPVEIRIGELHLDKPLLLWINDGLMAVFFMLIGLEVKREFLEGELSRPDQIILPGVGAIGGMLVPSAIYYWLNKGDLLALNGWAIPAATDIAFALGILALVGNRVPVSLRVFLMALAIFDDLGAVVIIAIFYTADLSVVSLIIALVAILGLFALNLLKIMRISAYIILGVILWVAVLKSGVHATLAGVLLGLMIPLKDPKNSERSPLREVEHGLHQWVALLIVPVFAFANAGISLSGLTVNALLEPIPLGIAAGLFLGKQIGILSFCGLAIVMGFARLPNGASWWGFYATSVLCGIGFTMSLFIASLAFEQGGSDAVIMGDRLGILLGSVLSAVLGFLIIKSFNPSVNKVT
ncbi:MAG: Na+/H+ antiporter NhaA [Candidatus Thiodiazotropha sp. (ex Lucinoma aequizonata)]|nr:Na+/H+ antiporter NhaA [Candidatus Thiodiazotropha sp. (ex Lucinoma aequizonata)]MCU7888456.1 Na+/H+ antiporter NhaA [Candidatus Thiodiazotropha sp. (ex Lucinoma aequizonata)]MCU7896269.1 Na+/H+ antiporter NhaA [Candidatus Thiodiazotropha sp. (ex Lucinoma aequizonata)]MCU7898504.1 Na+/H+ antiporter NhaA [Candidatus Thiodiazotropha sp. (ex Lucinoma aequizonata)]MCU7900652.1 Na+/H+ antiporter NhaA [Candidatus Thiodiazotropha sp. (ex Lucinoma aequizonata)]